MMTPVYIRPYDPLPPPPYGPPAPRPAPELFQTNSAPASGMSMLITRQPPPHQQIPRGDRCQYGRSPCRIECQYCGSYVITDIQYARYCCLSPCCSESYGDILHICPCCRNVVGRYDPMVRREEW